MRNRYSGNCFRCNKRVEEGEGFFQKVNKSRDLQKKFKTRWVVRCKDCVGTGNLIT